MKDIISTHKIVLDALENYPETRESSTDLYIQVCKMVNPIASSLPLTKALSSRKELGIPNFESVARAKRRIQNDRPDLRPCEEVQNGINENEIIARAYAKHEIP